MTALGDPEDPPPGKRFDEHAPTIPPGAFSGPDEITQTAIPSPLPPPAARPTVRLTPEQQKEIERQVYAHEHKRLAEALETIDRVLPTLASKAELEFVKQRLESFDAGVRMAIAAGENAAAAVDRLRADLSLWLFGEKGPDAKLVRTGIVHHIEAASELAKSALDSAGAANDTATRALGVALEAREAVEHAHAGNGAAG